MLIVSINVNITATSIGLITLDVNFPIDSNISRKVEVSGVLCNNEGDVLSCRGGTTLDTINITGIASTATTEQWTGLVQIQIK